MYEKYFERIREEGLLRNRTEGTIATYTANIKKFLDWTGDKNPDDLTLEDCRNYIYELRVEKKMSTQHCKRTLHAVLNTENRILSNRPPTRGLFVLHKNNKNRKKLKLHIRNLI